MGKRSRIPGLSRSVLPASTAAGEMDNFQLSISLSQKLSERQREERGETDVCNGNEAGGGQMRKIRQRQEGELMLA